MMFSSSPSQSIGSGFASNEVMNMVRVGWAQGAVPYRRAKDESLIRIPVVKQWAELMMQFRPAGVSPRAMYPVLDLGCGSGFPLAGYISNTLEERKYATAIYKGIDLSDEMIELAREEYPAMAESFEVCEMLDYCKAQPTNSICGAIAVSSIYHLPRSQHVELFGQLFRILKRGAPLLFTVPHGSDEGCSEDFLGEGIKMYWSHFSPLWYEITLQELGYELLTKFKEDKVFLGERETTWFLLFRIPDDDPVSSSSFTY
eukprot:TRINITY_DN8956_c0_g1_i1.p1 TRINITY_DN8956_c0_g1~~TRINITY_DN8956_c0_g1_i1.p1  ORF type:complete len:258 (-),score=48.92 TRINITY_DN8956_c0_g1_i1:52-825(-)